MRPTRCGRSSRPVPAKTRAGEERPPVGHRHGGGDPAAEAALAGTCPQVPDGEEGKNNGGSESDDDGSRHATWLLVPATPGRNTPVP
jgi:hypothetical protein